MKHRSHHFVPAFILAGFTREGSRDGNLCVLDRVKRAWRRSSPNKCGSENHFYTVNRADLDPLEAEHTLAKIEDHIAPIVRKVISSNVLPWGDDEESLINFVAVQDARTRAARLQGYSERQKSWIKEMQRTAAAGREAFTVRQAKNDPTLPDFATFDELVEGASNTKRLVFGDKTDDVGDAFKMARSSMDKFNRFHWTLIVPRPGAPDFVCSDAPVIHWTVSRGQERISGLGSGPLMPIGSRHALAGSVRPSTPRLIRANPALVGAINRTVALAPSRNVYTAVTDFHWLDESNKLRRATDLMARRGRWAAGGDDFIQEFF